jgi:hypothetical protein
MPAHAENLAIVGELRSEIPGSSAKPLLFVTSLFALFGTLFFADPLLYGQSAPSRSNPPAVQATAELLLLHYLKKPDTAKFSAPEETSIVPLASGRYEVSGWIDAQNDFGAFLRKRYTILVQPAANSSWRSNSPAFETWAR